MFRDDLLTGAGRGLGGSWQQRLLDHVENELHLGLDHVGKVSGERVVLNSDRIGRVQLGLRRETRRIALLFSVPTACDISSKSCDMR